MVLVVIVKEFFEGGSDVSSKEIMASEAARKLGWRMSYLYGELRAGRFQGARKAGAVWLIPISQVALVLRRRQERAEKAQQQTKSRPRD